MQVWNLIKSFQKDGGSRRHLKVWNTHCNDGATTWNFSQVVVERINYVPSLSLSLDKDYENVTLASTPTKSSFEARMTHWVCLDYGRFWQTWSHIWPKKSSNYRIHLLNLLHMRINGGYPQKMTSFWMTFLSASRYPDKYVNSFLLLIVSQWQ